MNGGTVCGGLRLLAIWLLLCLAVSRLLRSTCPIASAEVTFYPQTFIICANRYPCTDFSSFRSRKSKVAISRKSEDSRKFRRFPMKIRGEIVIEGTLLQPLQMPSQLLFATELAAFCGFLRVFLREPSSREPADFSALFPARETEKSEELRGEEHREIVSEFLSRGRHRAAVPHTEPSPLHTCGSENRISPHDGLWGVQTRQANTECSHFPHFAKLQELKSMQTLQVWCGIHNNCKICMMKVQFVRGSRSVFVAVCGPSFEGPQPRSTLLLDHRSLVSLKSLVAVVAEESRNEQQPNGMERKNKNKTETKYASLFDCQ